MKHRKRIHAARVGHGTRVSRRSRDRSTPVATTPRFSEIVRLLYEGVTDLDAWRTFLQQATEQLRGNGATLILRIPELGDVPHHVSIGGTPEAESAYYQRYLAMDPFIHLPEGKVITIHDFVGAEKFERSEFFHQWSESFDYFYIVGADLREEGRYDVRLRFCRSHHAGNFSPEDCAFVDSLVPHLRTALRLSAHLDSIDVERTVYEQAMDQLTLATIILDEHQRIVRTNRLADMLLAEHDGLGRIDGLLHLRNRDESEALQRAIAQALRAKHSRSAGLAEVMKVRRVSGRGHLTLVIRPVATRAGNPAQRQHPAVAVFVSTEFPGKEARTPCTGTIRKIFGLSPREALLALRLASGESIQEAAAGLGVTTNTARSQLRAIFNKTGVDRQAKLVRLLLQSVAMLGD